MNTKWLYLVGRCSVAQESLDPAKNRRAYRSYAFTGAICLHRRRGFLAERLLYLSTKDCKARPMSMKKPNSRLDLRGAISPLSLLKATKALGDLGAGQRLEILSTDDRTQKELSEILNPEQFRTVGVQKRKTYYRIILEKAPSQGQSRREERERG